MSLLVTIPHSGECIPPQTPWLNELPEMVLMCDVDRFVDVLYEPALTALQIPYVLTKWHRYAADLNRVPSDVNCQSVVGNGNPASKYGRGFHWVHTTKRERLMTQGPMSEEAHAALVKLIYDPFHASIRQTYAHLRQMRFDGRPNLRSGSSPQAGAGRHRQTYDYYPVFHIDAHSMPSVGTSEHLDPHERRADIVISDCKGTSCDVAFRDLVVVAYVTAGFKVGLNWPYAGGRVTQHYGRPLLASTSAANNGHKKEERSTSHGTSSAPFSPYDHRYNQHAIQVEINRSLYMNEVTKQLLLDDADHVRRVQDKLGSALAYIQRHLGEVERTIIAKQQLETSKL